MKKGLIKDLTGMTFGRLTVITEAGRTPAKKTLWLCKCVCGGEKVIIGGSLVSGRTKSCGCLDREKKEERNKSNTFGVTHGGYKHPLYSVWKQMRQRCHSPSHKMFKHYGARGVVVCEEWLRDFEIFFKWAMSEGYAKGLTIDRINNDGGYCPQNCRWVSRKEQNINKRITKKIDGVPLVTLLEKYNVSPRDKGAIRSRIIDLGWDVEKAITTPISYHKIRGVSE